jgi:hypothetical protein
LRFGETVKPIPMTVVLYFYISTFWSMCEWWLFSVVRYCAFQVADQVLSERFWNGFSYTYECILLVPLLFWHFQMRCIFIVRSLCCKMFSASFLIRRLSPDTTIIIIIIINIAIIIIIIVIMNVLQILFYSYKRIHSSSSVLTSALFNEFLYRREIIFCSSVEDCGCLRIW